MKQKSFADMRCSIARSLEEIGPWWALLIIREAFMGARRFKHFEQSLGIAKNTLTARLNHLVATGILFKAPAADGSSYSDYLLTEKGLDLLPVVIALAQWGDKWAAHEDGPAFTVIDGKQGAPIDRLWPRRPSGEKIPLTEFGIEVNTP